MIQTLQKNNVTIQMDIETEYEQHRFDTFFAKEPETISWIDELFKPGDVFYDIGACIGVFTLYASIRHNQSIRVYAFEPAYHNFDKLNKNLYLNNVQGFTRAYCCAVDATTRAHHIDLASSTAGSANHVVGNARNRTIRNIPSVFRQGILCVTLDDLVSTFGLPNPQHIKIDVDGFEEHVLKGGESILKNEHLTSVLIEITDVRGAKDRIIKLMGRAGMSADHPINDQENHSRKRRQESGKGHILNIIFTR